MSVDLCDLDQVYHVLKICATLEAGLTFERVQFHRDQVEWSWNRKLNSFTNITASTIGQDFVEGIFIGEHQVHRQRLGRLRGEMEANEVGRPVEDSITAFLKKSEPSL